MAIVRDKTGAQQEVKLGLGVYKAALDANLTVPQYINRKYETDDAQFGTAFEQLCVSSGLIMGRDRNYGLKPPTLGDVLSGKAEYGLASVADADPTSRTLYPATILELIDSQISINRSADPSAFDKMVAQEISVTSNRVEQPVINYTNVEASRSKAISQLAEPSAMLSITTSDITRTMPTLCLSLEVSDQALQATTLDFVGKSVQRQAEVEANARAYDFVLGFLNGDSDNSQSALAQTCADTYDSTIVTAGTVTKKAIISWLMHNYYKRRINFIVTDLAGMFAVEAAFSTTNTGNFPIPGLVPQFSLVNRMMENLQFFVTDPTVAAWPANTLMGLDSRSAVVRYTNVTAAYSAVERFVLRRSSVLRVDNSSIAFRMFDDAFDVLSLALTTT